MLVFAWPWAGVLLLLPLLVYHFSPPSQEQKGAALWVPRLDPFQALIGSRVEKGRRPRKCGWRRLFLLGSMALIWLLLVLACARPQWLGEPVQLPLAGRDLLLCVDLSGSMNIEDFSVHGRQVPRLTALQVVADDFIARRQGDRVGLILFADKPYVQTPLTFDRKTVRQLLDEAVIGLAGDRTAIGDAIGLGVKHLRNVTASRQSAVMILLTDGSNNSGVLLPEQAAAIAAQEGIRIHTIGIGAEQMEVGGLFARTVNPSADMDEVALLSIAEKTGGNYFRARDTVELNKIYTQIDALEPVDSDARYYRPFAEVYPWPLALALALLVGLLLSTALGVEKQHGD